MDKQYTSVEEQVEYGLDSVDPARRVEVPLRDLLYVFQTLGEYIGFFHNPGHYSDLAAVRWFIGNREAGAFKPLCEAYYEKLRPVLPEDISDGYDGGPFDNPHPPYYHMSPD